MDGLVYSLAALVGIDATALGGYGMVGGAGTVRLPWLVPLGGLELTLDPLGGFFLMLIGSAAVPASIYAMGAAPGERRDRFTYLAFVLSMCLVPLAANMMTFAITWELMSIASYFLVLHNRESKSSVYAGWVYAVMTHAGLACLLAGMLLLDAWTGSPRFEDWRAAAPALTGAARNGAFVLLALGFAGKAGVVPLHVWLPLAHPAAPSHVSALMSGVMVKLGVYGLLRIGLDWLGGGPPWWGVFSRPRAWSTRRRRSPARSSGSSISSTGHGSGSTSTCIPSRASSCGASLTRAQRAPSSTTGCTPR